MHLNFFDLNNGSFLRAFFLVFKNIKVFHFLKLSIIDGVMDFFVNGYGYILKINVSAPIKKPRNARFFYFSVKY